MKAFRKIILSLTLAIAIVMPSLSFEVSAATYVANWGERGVVATALSDRAVAFYNKYGVEYSEISQKAGLTYDESNKKPVPANTPLYDALQSVMVKAQNHVTDYDETRGLYKYTDCIGGKTANISCFYTGKTLSSTWDSGSTWNREHTWPNSKGLAGSDENDIMMLRPTVPSENGSRGNKAYGVSSGYHNPGESVHGDCARIALYVYVRWGNTSFMWGSAGVIENLEILLQWM